MSLKYFSLFSVVLSTHLSAQVSVITAPLVEKPKDTDTKDLHLEKDTISRTSNEFIGSFNLSVEHTRDGKPLEGYPLAIEYRSDLEHVLMRRKSPNGKNVLPVLVDLKKREHYVLRTAADQPLALRSVKMRPKEPLAPDTAGYHLQPTGDTKEIMGLMCAKVVGTSPKGTWEGWVTKDVPNAYRDMANALSTEQRHPAQVLAEENALVLEFDWWSTDKREHFRSVVRNLVAGEVETKDFILNGYEVRDDTVEEKNR